MVPSDSGSPCTVSESWRRAHVPREASQTATRRPLLHPRPSGIPSLPTQPTTCSVWIGNEQNDRGGDETRDRPRAYVLLAPSWDDPSNQSRECCTDDANTEPHEEF